MESIFGENDPNVNQETGEKEPSPETLAQLKGGASWFYWIAALSLINSLIFAFGGDVSFIAGLGITQVVDALAQAWNPDESFTVVRFLALAFNLIVVALFGLFGYYANKASNAAFIGGMVIYLLDGLIWLFLDSILGFGFHIFALIMIFRGFMASREIHRIREHNMIAAA